MITFEDAKAMCHRMKPTLLDKESIIDVLNGVKTQIRKPISEVPLHSPYFENYDGKAMSQDEYGDWYPTEMFCPIRPGDIIWVRETFRVREHDGNSFSYAYYATDEDSEEIRWKPAILMPKEAARLFLRVLRVRVERLQSISKEDLTREGIKGVRTKLVPYCTECFDCGNCWEVRPIDEFADKWDSRLGYRKRRRYKFSNNPWVWVFDFELIKV